MATPERLYRNIFISYQDLFDRLEKYSSGVYDLSRTSLVYNKFSWTLKVNSKDMVSFYVNSNSTGIDLILKNLVALSDILFGYNIKVRISNYGDTKDTVVLTVGGSEEVEDYLEYLDYLRSFQPHLTDSQYSIFLKINQEFLVRVVNLLKSAMSDPMCKLYNNKDLKEKYKSLVLGKNTLRESITSFDPDLLDSLQDFAFRRNPYSTDTALESRKLSYLVLESLYSFYTTKTVVVSDWYKFLMTSKLNRRLRIYDRAVEKNRQESIDRSVKSSVEHIGKLLQSNIFTSDTN